MVPKEFRKNLCVIAGWVSLLEALVWGAASIYAVGVYGCSWNFFHTNKGPNTWSMLYVTYLMGGCRGATGAAELGFVLNPPAEPAKHLHIWLWVHMVVSVAWIPACILLTVAASMEVRGRQGAILYYPWIILSSAFVVLDLAGAIYHFLDVLKTTTPDYYASLTDNTTWSSLTKGASSDGITTWLPSLLITFFFCRFLILWGINIILLYVVYKGCNSVSLYTTKYLQSSMMPEENQKSWKKRFYQGPDPSLFDQSSRPNHTEANPKSSDAERQRTDESHQNAVKERMEDFGIPEDLQTQVRGVGLDHSDQERSDRGRRSPIKPGFFDYSGRPVHSDAFKEQWKDNNAPPIASGVQVPPELNKFEPFSYIAGDQPQRMRRPLSRSNSRGDQPMIPRPDYTIADRRAASLEFVPNRFRVPSPKRLQSQSAFNLDSTSRPVTAAKVAPTVPNKPSVYPRPIPEDLETRYVPQQAGSHQPSYYNRQNSGQNNNYNINKLY